MPTPKQPNESVAVVNAKGLADRDWINYWRDIASSVPAAVSGANPSGLIGMTAVNGVATTFARSDGRHAIDPAIAPNWTGTHNFGLGLRFAGAQAAGSIIGADAFSATNGVNFNLTTFTGSAWLSTAARIYGNGDAEFGFGSPLLSADVGHQAIVHVRRNVSGSHPNISNDVRSAIRGTTTVNNGCLSAEWSILGIITDDGGLNSTVGVYGQNNKTRDRSGQASWGGCFEIHGRSLTAGNPVGSEIGIEVSMSGTGADNNGARTAILVSCFTDQNIPPTYQVHNGLLFQAEFVNSAVLKTGIQFASSLASVGVCMDTTFITSLTGYVLKMKGSQKTSYNNGTDGLYYDAGSTGLRYDTGSYSYVFHNNGGIDAAAFNVVSDIRFKRDVTPLTGGLAIIQRLQPKWFEQKNGDEWKHHLGFIADDLEDVLPDVVTTGPDDIKRVDYSRMPDAVTVSAIQELNARVAALEAR